MGWAARWFLGLLRGRKSADGGSTAENRPAKEKKRWRFMKSFREKEKDQHRREYPPQPPEKGKVSYREPSMGSISDGDEQAKHSIAVSAAAAAAAEAAVAAAQAAAAVVRLTGSGRSVGLDASGAMPREDWNVIKIQAAFRGYLARRALRALRSVVKLQALVRGNIVRKQAAETLRCMQALVRVQAHAHAFRALRSEANISSRISRSNPVPPTPSKSDRSGSIKRNSSKKNGADCAHRDGNHSEQWNWLDQWIEERYTDGQEASKTADDEKNAKILEVDTVKTPPITSKRKTKQLVSSSPMNSEQNSQSLAAAPASPSKDSTAAPQSVPSPSSTVVLPDSLSPLRFPVDKPEEHGERAEFFSATSHAGSSSRGAFTPANCDCSRSLFSGCSDCPNYMTNTESSRAKARSHSAPKQRPGLGKSSSMKRLSDHSFSLHKSSLHAKFAINEC